MIFIRFKTKILQENPFWINILKNSNSTEVVRLILSSHIQQSIFPKNETCESRVCFGWQSAYHFCFGRPSEHALTLLQCLEYFSMTPSRCIGSIWNQLRSLEQLIFLNAWVVPTPKIQYYNLLFFNSLPTTVSLIITSDI